METDVHEHFRTRPHDVDGLLDRLWHAYGRVVFAFLASRVRDRDRAADLCQEAFARAVEFARHHPPPQVERVNFRGWLLTIARNVLIAQRRRPGIVLSWTSVDAAADDPYAAVRDGEAVDPAAAAVHEEVLATMRKCLETLPATWREALLMVHLEETAPADAARALGASPGNLRVILHRGRTRLRKCLDERLEPAPGTVGSDG